MCGIVGYTGNHFIASKVVLDGLEQLEYRGYDSAGIAVITDGILKDQRESGKPHQIRPLLEKELGDNHLAIGHTRWATHGKPSQSNAHPHIDNASRWVVVHNGIIENYLQIKEHLMENGHQFHSDTDTEIIAHLIAHYENGDPMTAFLKALRKLEGAYALAVCNVDHPEKIFIARKNCPLIVGHCEDHVGSFIASDVVAMIRHTRKVVFLEDGQAGIVSPGQLELFEIDSGTAMSHEFEQIEWNPVAAEKGGYKHFMLKEIHEQPSVIRNTLDGRTDEERGEILLDELNLSPEIIRGIKRIHILGCGTAYYSGMVGKYLIERLSGIPAEAELASEYRYRDPYCDDSTLVIAVSQSGETADTIAATRLAKEKGARTIGFLNVKGSTLSREVDGNFFIFAGPEIGVASTKAYMAMVVAFELFSLFLARSSESLSKEEVRELIHELKVIPQKIETVLQEKSAIEKHAYEYLNFTDFLYLGRDLDYPTALEGALKLKEISYIHAEGYAAGEMKHGPIALLDRNCPVVAILTRGPIYQKVVSNVIEARSRDCRVLAIGTKGDESLEKIVDDILWVPPVHPFVSPLINVVPLQLFAYYVADLKGADVDQPRNLAKSVTVE